MLRPVRSLAPALVLLVLAGCGDAGPTPEEQVRATVGDFGRATAAKDYRHAVRPDPRAAARRQGHRRSACRARPRCAQGLGAVRDPHLTIGRVQVDGDSASAEIRTSAAGEAAVQGHAEAGQCERDVEDFLPGFLTREWIDVADEQISDHIEALVKEEHELLDRGGVRARARRRRAPAARGDPRRARPLLGPAAPAPRPARRRRGSRGRQPARRRHGRALPAVTVELRRVRRAGRVRPGRRARAGRSRPSAAGSS